jgi:hypothetical protein
MILIGLCTQDGGPPSTIYKVTNTSGLIAVELRVCFNDVSELDSFRIIQTFTGVAISR